MSGFSHCYSVLVCPDCGADLTQDDSVELEVSVGGVQLEFPTKLLKGNADLGIPEGLLDDVDDLVGSGYHIGTACFVCGRGLSDKEIL